MLLRESQMTPKISLLHATYHREGGPLHVKKTWIERAARPELIEYIFAMDCDDTETFLQTEGHHRVVGPSGGGHVTAVRNWNAAAAEARGDLLMVIADDLFPPQDWDTTLVRLIEPLDPVSTPFAVKITDSPHEADVLLRHPVVSRAYYRLHGLFSADYHGVYCDEDITTRAFWRAVILDGRSLVFEHRHPTLDASVVRSVSQSRVNNVQEFRRGKEIYIASWTRRQRKSRKRLIHTTSGAPLNDSVLCALRWRNLAWETAGYPLRCAREFTKLICRPRELLKKLSGR